MRAALPALLMKNHEIGALKWRGLQSCGSLAAFNLHAVASAAVVHLARVLFANLRARSDLWWIFFFFGE